MFYTSVFLLLIIGLRLVIIVLLQPIKGLFFLMMLGVELLRVLFVVTFIYSYWRMGRVQVDLWGAPQQM